MLLNASKEKWIVDYQRRDLGSGIVILENLNEELEGHHDRLKRIGTGRAQGPNEKRFPIVDYCCLSRVAG